MTLFLLITVFGPVGAGAVDSPVNHLQPPAAHRQTVKALQAINQDRWTVGRDLIASTRDPLASKLYYWMLFTKEKGDNQFTRLAQFIRGNPEWPAIKDLRDKAEENMPAALSPTEVSAWFADYEPQTAAGMNRYVSALIAQGKTDVAINILAKWWASTLLTRDEQRQIFGRYGSLIDFNAHTRRLDMLLFNKQYTNARAIAGVLGKGYPELTEARIALAEKKGNIQALINRVPGKLQNDPGLLYERLHWRRENKMDVEAMAILHKMPPADQIQNPEDWWQERHIIIRRLLERKSYESAYLLAKDHKLKEGQPYSEAEWMAGWLALRFLKNPTKALQHFEALYQKVETPISKARAAYWAGRASENFSDKTISNAWYQKAAKFQTVFYGQLAGAELGLAQALPNAAPPVITAEDKAKFKAAELVQAAHLFHEAGMSKQATRFIQAFVKSEKSPKAYRFAAETAADMGRYADAIRIAKDATKEGMFLTSQSYPMITDKLRNVNVEWALIHSLIRQESMFDEMAKSPVGATGLMQLMPGTAKEVSQKEGLPYNPGALTQPAYNIRLGSSYINELVRRFAGSYTLAIAGYNAGPGRVNQWLETYGDPRTGEVDLIDWIEMIPIYETRNYVQRVLEGVYVYRLRLRGIQKEPQEALHVVMNNRS